MKRGRRVWMRGVRRAGLPYRFVTMDAARRAEVLQGIDQNAALGQNFLVLVLLSCLIATFGLIQNSAAVIIGAMLVAPLMGPIIAFALALVHGDPRRAARALRTLLIGAAMAVLLSAALGWVVALVGTVDFRTEGLPAEILGRTQPSLFDLAVALAGGAAGSYALVQPRLSAALAGVAIATALMPPLCVVGIGVALGQMAVWGGGLLLFLTNFVAIVFAGSAIFALAGFLPEGAPHRRLFLRARLVNLLLLLPVAILLTTFTVSIARQAQTTAAIHDTLVGALRRHRDTNLIGFGQTTNGDTLQIVATIRSPATLKLTDARRIEATLAARLRERVALQVLLVPMTTLDPLNPPTVTATPTPRRSPIGRDATHNGGAASLVPTQHGTVDDCPTVRATVTATRTSAAAAPTSRSIRPPPPTATWTVTPTPRQTATPRPRATPRGGATPRSIPTRPPSPTAPGTRAPTVPPVAYAVVAGTGGVGVYAHQSPGLTAIVTALPDGTIVQRTGRQVGADGYLWVQVILPDGRVVWIPRAYLVPYRAYTPPHR